MARRRPRAAGPEEVPVSELKSRCSEIIDRVARGSEFVITRRGQPVARLKSEGAERRNPRGSWQGLIEIAGDIVQVDWSEEFEVLQP
jgi:prevent-host-death family protein